MTQPTNTFDSYDAIGNREDLANIIDMISPTDTPFLSGIAKIAATATNHEFQTDALAAPSSTNAVIEGDDATTEALTPTVRLGNFTQISDKVPRVTGTQNAVDSAGRSDEMAYQIMKKAKELKNDVESSLLASNAKVGGSSSVARECAGIPAWLATNVSVGATGSAATGDGTDTPTNGTQRPFTEVLLQGVLASCWDEGGNPDTIMVGSFNKQAASAFTGNATRNINSGEKKLVTAIDVYVGDFGDLVIIPSRHMRARDALVLEMDKWKFAVLRDFQSSPLAKTGDTEREQMLVEYTLQASNEAASGAVFDLDTA